MSVTATDGNSRRPGPVLANALERFECSGALPSIVMKSTPRGPRAISSAQGLRDGSMSRCGTSRRMARKAQPAIAAAASVRKIMRGRARVPATVAQPRPAVPLQAQLAAQARHPAPHRPQGSSPPPGSAGTAGRSSARCPRWAAAAVCTAATNARPSTSWPSPLSPAASSATADSPNETASRAIDQACVATRASADLRPLARRRPRRTDAGYLPNVATASRS